VLGDRLLSAGFGCSFRPGQSSSPPFDKNFCIGLYWLPSKVLDFAMLVCSSTKTSTIKVFDRSSQVGKEALLIESIKIPYERSSSIIPSSRDLTPLGDSPALPPLLSRGKSKRAFRLAMHTPSLASFAALCAGHTVQQHQTSDIRPL
jgi:hypothetical protein